MSELVTIARGDASRIVEPRRLIVRSADEWRALWALHAGPGPDPPAVDFAARVVAAAFAGQRPSSGHSIEIVQQASRDGAELATSERGPAPGMMAAQVLTFPFHIVTVPRTASDPRWADASGSAAATPRSSGTSKIPSSTGLEPRTASLLAYLAGPFSGALILMAETSNDDVRFHAWQSIVALGGLGLLVALGYLTALASVFVSATALSVLVRVSTVLWIVLLIVWAFCLWKTYSDGRWRLPLIGDWAERLALRTSPARADS